MCRITVIYLHLVLLALVLPACHGTSGQNTYPDDPLFVIRTPLETKNSGLTGYKHTVFYEPSPPKAPPLVQFAVRRREAVQFAKTKILGPQSMQRASHLSK